MDTLLSMRVFQAVVDHHGFSAAADHLDLSKAMVSKHIMHLERRLGARLLNRNSRHLSLTEPGRTYLQRCRSVLEELDEVEAVISRANVNPRGEIRVTAPMWLANTEFTGLLSEFRTLYPEVTFDFDISGRFVDIVEEGFDLALRASQTLNPSLIARPLLAMPFRLVASPDYLQRRGHPEKPADMRAHDMLTYSLVSKRGQARLHGPEGEVTLRMTSVMASNNEFLLYQAALQGMGVGLLPEGLVSHDLAAGRLCELLPDYRLPAPSLYAVYTSRRYMTSKIRLFIDFLSARMGAHMSVPR
ncbi:LysR family transcriptional regulator [Natronospirillum operosum]|uniref:LysR family transcriptional regulator n=1 Tax=Natronospirillum operosum TaxID=2759953 RepID=A0A4Z0WAF2_9GAMM|nr:LysR family transcriptional regulator [Natronospirillum operosum]TGG94169.1 LysR family transcriptional regulator [Natronospirillum operosum]